MASGTRDCHDECENPPKKSHTRRSANQKLAKLITQTSTTTVTKREQVYRKILKNHISLIESSEPPRMPQLLESGICHLETTPTIITRYYWLQGRVPIEKVTPDTSIQEVFLAIQSNLQATLFAGTSTKRLAASFFSRYGLDNFGSFLADKANKLQNRKEDQDFIMQVACELKVMRELIDQAVEAEVPTSNDSEPKRAVVDTLMIQVLAAQETLGFPSQLVITSNWAPPGHQCRIKMQQGEKQEPTGDILETSDCQILRTFGRDLNKLEKHPS